MHKYKKGAALYFFCVAGAIVLLHVFLTRYNYCMWLKYTINL